MRLTRFRIVLIAGFVVTALWLYLVAAYVQVEIGWGNLLAMLPHETVPSSPARSHRSRSCGWCCSRSAVARA